MRFTRNDINAVNAAYIKDQEAVKNATKDYTASSMKFNQSSGMQNVCTNPVNLSTSEAVRLTMTDSLM